MNVKSACCWSAEFLARILLAAVFLYASWSKIQDPALFATVVESYRMPIPGLLVGWIAIVLPVAEAVAGLALLFTKWSRESAAIILFMLLVFLVGLTQAWARGLEISCGCFGPDDGEAVPLWLDILRDIGLLVPTVWLVLRPNRWLFGRR